MAKNIEININTGSSYETLYPVTDYNQLLNKPAIPTVPSLPLSVANGGHASTTASGGVYNLVNPLSTRSASQLNSYASSTYIPCTYSTSGYKFPLNNILNYIQNNISVSTPGFIVQQYSYTGNGSSATISFSSLYKCKGIIWASGGGAEDDKGTYVDITIPSVWDGVSSSFWFEYSGNKGIRTNISSSYGSVTITKRSSNSNAACASGATFEVFLFLA